MAIPKWPYTTNPVILGEQVKPTVANRYPGQINERAEYLKHMLETISDKSALILWEVPVKSDVEEKDAVFYNSATEQYEKAIVAMETDSTLGQLVASPSTYAVGVVHSKLTSTLANIVIYGKMPDMDLEDTSPGLLYLSQTEAGKLVNQSPPVSIVLGMLFSDGSMMVMPQYKDLLESHVHYRFELVCEDAADETEEGWLAADHEIFEGKAPEGAILGYNISANESLSSVFPPIPVSSAVVVLYDEEIGTFLDATGSCKTVSITEDGVWLMEDMEWSSSSSECPVQRMELYFTKMNFKTGDSIVTEIHPAVGSPVTVTDINGDEASIGKVYVGINHEFTEGLASSAWGDYAYKEIDGLLLKKGHVVSGITSLSPSLVLSGGTAVNVNGTIYRKGAVALDYVAPGDLSREGAVELIALDNATEVIYQGALYVGMPTGKESSITLRIGLGQNLPENAELSFEIIALGRGAGTLPDLDLSYRRVVHPGSSAVSLTDLDTVDVEGAFTFGAVLANQYRAAQSTGFAVADEDIIFATITRNIDGYSSDMGLLRIKYIISSSSSSE
jgi:hypothetical protein